MPGGVYLAVGLRDAVATRQGVVSSYTEIGVMLGSPNPILDALRRAPLLGRLVPVSAEQPIIGRPATYRLRLIRCRPPACSLPVPTVWQVQDGGSA